MISATEIVDLVMSSYTPEPARASKPVEKDPAPCAHSFRKIVKRQYPKCVRWQSQCQECGDSQTLPKKDVPLSVRLEAGDYNADLKLAYDIKMENVWLERRLIGATFEDTRRIYFSSGKWYRLRNRVLERDHKACVKCGTRSGWECGSLHAHHLTYDRFTHENLEDLITLCEDCHEIAHGRKFIYDRDTMQQCSSSVEFESIVDSLLGID